MASIDAYSATQADSWVAIALRAITPALDSEASDEAWDWLYDGRIETRRALLRSEPCTVSITQDRICVTWTIRPVLFVPLAHRQGVELPACAYAFKTVYFRCSTRSAAVTVIGMDLGLPPDTALIFDQDEDLSVFESFLHATDVLEAIDVSEGEYTAAYSPDGGVLALTAPEGWEGPVVMTRTGRGDLVDLERRVARYWQRHQMGKPPLGRLETARSLIDRDDQPRAGWLSRVTGLLRRNSSGDEPAAS